MQLHQQVFNSYKDKNVQLVISVCIMLSEGFQIDWIQASTIIGSAL